MPRGATVEAFDDIIVSSCTVSVEADGSGPSGAGLL
jgi:hypothetical protein